MRMEELDALVSELFPEVVRIRRKLHENPEPGFEEWETSRMVQQILKAHGYSIKTGKEAVGSFTGVLASLYCGPGPVIAMRFDMDALPVSECEKESHVPVKEGFCSRREGWMHACGHDGHTAIGIGTGILLSRMRGKLSGTIQLLFQPAEEGCRGAKAMADSGILDNTDYFLAAHIYSREILKGEEADFLPAVEGSLATTKLNAVFHGRTAHGSMPQEGDNVNLSLASALLNLQAIPRNSRGATFINVGTINGGTGRNVIADQGKLELEVRGETSELNQYMEEYAFRILKACAMMHNTRVEIETAGSAPSIHSDLQLAERIRKLFGTPESPVIPSRKTGISFPASEDVAHLMKRVQEHGGQAVFMLLATETRAALHQPDFDFNEEILKKGMLVFSETTTALLSKTRPD